MIELVFRPGPVFGGRVFRDGQEITEVTSIELLPGRCVITSFEKPPRRLEDGYFATSKVSDDQYSVRVEP
ncbi:MAG: hypothetical protein PHS14_12970 [Elusimicrobia bacterium]|nr:hypothetical protein [Elusimicrobiota bacterium]